MMMITSSYKVNALEYDNIFFPDFPDDGYDSYVLYYASGSYNDGIPYGYNLVKFNKNDVKYLHYKARSSVQQLTLSKDFCFENCINYDVTADEDYKIYNYNKTTGEWDIKSKTSGRNYLSLDIHTIFTSNINIYSDSETYKNSKLYKDSNGSISYTFKRLTSDYSEFTINPPTSLEDIKDYIVYSPIITKPIEINFEFVYLDENNTDFTDENGNIFKKLKVKYGDVYNKNYKYLISFDNQNWIDVSKQFKQNDNSYIPNAYFNINFSNTIYAKVTKKDDTLISENSIFIELDKDLEKVGYVDSKYMNLKYVEFEIDNLLQGFSPTRFAVQYSPYGDVSNMPNYLKYEVIIEDNNQNSIDVDLNEYYFFKESSLQYKDYKGVFLDIVNINYKIPPNAINLKVRFYFDNTENYFMNFYTTNPKFNTKVDYYDEFFSNYKKYKFPEGYNKAIIKPINKNSSNGNVLFMKKFANSDIDFFYYDFNSYTITKNIFETAQRDLTEYDIGGYNSVFKKYDFSIDVENKIYPIIHNKREKYCLGGQDVKEDYNFISGWTQKQCDVYEVQHGFYLPYDYYVEFVNLETDSKIVKNISDEDFEKDNNLDINDNFKDQMNEKYPFYNEENNKLLNKLNNYIEQLKAMYLDYFPFIGQLKELYDIFSINISEDTTPPVWEINVNFEPLRIKFENLKIMDFSFFEEYKELLFNFEKLFLSFYTIIGIVNNIKKGSA